MRTIRGDRLLKKPCFGMNNHFSGSRVDALLGEKGYKSINTCRRDRLPNGCKKFFHYIMVVEVNTLSKMTRFEQPIVAVKEVKFPATPDKNSYCIVHVSLWSVNAIDEVEIYVSEREKGRVGTKNIWAIEVNKRRDLYLKIYVGVD